MANTCTPNRPQQGFPTSGYGQIPYGGAGSGPYGESLPQPTPAPSPGYILPVSTNLELNDAELRHLLQPLICGITGLPKTFVRPRWQKEPPNQPPIDTDWAAFGSTSRTRDVFPAVLHCTDPNTITTEQPVGLGRDYMYRNQEIEVLCSFYGPNCEQYSEFLAMGLGLEQNKYVLQLNGFALIEVQQSLVVPWQVKAQQWNMGVDVPFRLRRQQNYVYESPNLVAAQATLNSSDNFNVAILANQDSEE